MSTVDTLYGIVVAASIVAVSFMLILTLTILAWSWLSDQYDR